LNALTEQEFSNFKKDIQRRDVADIFLRYEEQLKSVFLLYAAGDASDLAAGGSLGTMSTTEVMTMLKGGIMS
jgi:hypothetical protein